MKKIALITLLFSYFIGTANAQIDITIRPIASGGVPIAIVPFAGGDKLPHEIHKIISNDLRMSGKFEPIDANTFLALPTQENEVQFKDWRLIGAELLAIGNVVEKDKDTYLVTFLLYDVAQQKRMGGYRYSKKKNEIREMSHEISDYIYEKRTGKKGVYTTKVAFVKRTKQGDQLRVADWDGFNAQTVVSSKEPIMSPDWSADGQKIAFVTFEKGRSMIKSVSLRTGKVENLVSSKRGLNSAPAFSPNGQSLAFASSRTGNSEIFVMDLQSKQIRKITNHWTIDTEPAWSPDGRSLLFTSGRSGKANVYQIGLNGQGAQRLTFNGDESSDSKMSPDGRNIVTVSDGGTTVLTGSGQLIRTLFDSGYDESPSFSGNGDMVVFGIKQGYTGKLMVSSVDGRVLQALDLLSGDVRDSAWSPN